ncbi:hypothetical protein [Pectobacterium carotovorum]|uniref:hypothetical protein n=1 Tax=Pectobacterium carotovorum TaxID=554 RepID=UPI00382CF43C
MNKLKCANYRDEKRLDILTSRSSKMASVPALASEVEIVKAGYRLYRNNRGNPNIILSGLKSIAISKEMGAVLSHYYDEPSKPVKFIDKIRDDYSIRCCPMCGSFFCGTLDHYLPQTPHKIFAIFSLNLVPSCMCNSRRGNRLVGKNANERFLHPYFDDCLQQRLIKVDFHHLDSTPITNSRVILPETDPNFISVNYHFQKLVKEKLEKYTQDRFINFCRRPAVYVTSLWENPKSIHHLRNILEWELQAKDKEFGSNNNWDSLFAHALLDDHVFTWLANKILAPGRRPNMPLVPL